MDTEREKTEYLEIYTCSGVPTGRLFDRKDFSRLKSDEYMLCVHVYITDGQGNWLLQKRSASKSFLPGVWDVTAGAVDPGEDGRQAAARELWEELGIKVSRDELRFHCRFPKGQGLIELWSLVAPVDICSLTLQPSEVDDAAWFTRQQTLELVAQAEGTAGDYMDSVAKLMNEV